MCNHLYDASNVDAYEVECISAIFRWSVMAQLPRMGIEGEW